MSIFQFKNPLAIGSNVGRGNIRVPGCALHETAQQTIPVSGAATAVTFSFKDADNGNLFTSTLPSRITFRVGGLYLVLGSFIWVADGTGSFREGTLRLNGVTSLDVDDKAPNATLPPPHRLMRIYRFAARDYVELTALHDSVATQNINAAWNAILSAFWVSA